MIPQILAVSSVTTEASGIVTLDFPIPPGINAQPGQFAMVYAFGAGEIPLSFSRLQGGTMSCTVRAVGRVSNALQRVRRGDDVGFRGPFGQGWPQIGTDNHVTVIAGGLGIAPLRPVIEDLVERQITGQVLYGARQPEDLLFTSQHEQWREHLDVTVTVDGADAGWTGRVGTILTLLEQLPEPAEKQVILLCGPDMMLRLVIRDLLERGYDPQTIFVSMERNMKCAIGQCGRCQWGPELVCTRGPVFPLASVQHLIFERGI